MRFLLEKILYSMKVIGIVNEADEDIYRFGLECVLLEILHYSSYIVISMVLQMTLPMLVSFMILIPLRRKSGGFHAKTKLGCYLFSCIMVFIICLLNKICYPLWIVVVILLFSNVIVVVLVPVENENRLLNEFERGLFRRQSLFLVVLADICIAIAILEQWIGMYWLVNGIAAEGVLVLIGKVNQVAEKIRGRYMLIAYKRG